MWPTLYLYSFFIGWNLHVVFVNVKRGLLNSISKICQCKQINLNLHVYEISDLALQLWAHISLKISDAFWYMYNVSVQFSIINFVDGQNGSDCIVCMHLAVEIPNMYQIYWNIILSVSFYLLFLWSCFRNVFSAVSSLFSLSSLSVPHHPCNIIQTVLWPSTHKGMHI